MYFEDVFSFNADMQTMSQQYASFVHKIVNEPLNYSNKMQLATRFHWESVYQMSWTAHPFSLAGIYLFGHKETPLYVGKTKRSYGGRFSDRYFGQIPKMTFDAAIRGDESVPQFLFADYFKDLLRSDGGWQAVKARYPKAYESINRPHPGNPPTRIKHAQKLAKLGMDDVWLTLLPCKSASSIENNEKKLIGTANRYNKVLKYEDILNVQHKNYIW